MPDLDMIWSGDLSISPTGDLTMIDGPKLGTERVLRRLMTNPNDYIWNPTYGAGLGQYVGLPIDVATVEALILAQMKLEAAVAQTPEPVIDITSDPTGMLYVQIHYADAATSVAASVSLNVTG